MRWADLETKHYIALAIVALVIVGAGVTSYFSRRDVGITETEIPPETIEFLKKLAKALSDLTFDFKKGKKSDWTNQDDNKQAADRGFEKAESEYFIVYFHIPDRQKADFTVDKATEAIGLMKETFRRYPYPKDTGGRKLPLYVCESMEEYQRLSGERSGFSIACASIWFYTDGSTLCQGLFFSPRAYEQSSESAETVAHELAHFVYFDKLKADHRIEVPTWFTEGIAVYASKDTDFLIVVEEALRNGSLIPLTVLSIGSKKFLIHPIVYGEGLSAFLTVEEHYGKDDVLKLVNASYWHDMDGSFRISIEKSLSEFEHEWRAYLRSRFAR